MTTTYVAGTVSLNHALLHAQAGDTILLAGGNYSGVVIQNIQFAGNVTIASADPTHNAVITDMNVRGSSGLTFSNVEFSSDPSIPGVGAAGRADPDPVRVANSDRIAFANDSFHGTMNNDPTGDRNGLYLDHSSDVSITGSTFQQLAYGIVHTLSSNVVISGNDFHDIRSDGVHGTSSFMTVTNNYFHDFHPVAGDHPDAVQFWSDTPSTSAPHDITVSDNLVVRGDGGAIEGIFLRLPDTAAAKFQNVTITNNTLVGTMYDGITVLGGQNVAIGNNTVQSAADMNSRIWIGNSNGVTETDNQAGAFIYGSDASQTHTATTSNTNILVMGSTILAPLPDGGGAPGPTAPAPLPAPMPAPALDFSGLGDMAAGSLHLGFGWFFA